MVKIGYVRVSTDKQDPASQKKLLLSMGIPEPEIYVDEGISGWVDPTARPIYKKMMKRIADQTKEKVDTIVFSEFSRIGRNALEGLAELVRLGKMGITIKSLSSTENFLNDIPEPWQGYILHGMMLGAEIERKHHKERTQWAIDNVKANGSKSGKKIGRPMVPVDFEKITQTMEKYNVSENVARKICGYSPSTFYNAKKRLQK